ncbi:MAG: glycosyltransferase [Gemmatimonadaceae bacterium]|nr:glycosyltransferase [Gemmatimonadaceae bacterium]
MTTIPTHRTATVDPGPRTADVSVLVPARDEAENLPTFLDLCAEAFQGRPERYEVVVIDDGSRDDTAQVLVAAAARHPFLRTVRHRSPRGIADALRTGYQIASGDVLVFYPADLQFLPADIPRLVGPVLAGECDMVTGRKEGKYEKALVSGVYNALSRFLFRVPVRDLNNVKAWRREVMEGQPARPDWHRYMIVLAAAQGFTVREIPVALYPRRAGRSKFGLSRIPVGVLDMLSVWFELRFGRKPLLAFGILGAGMFSIAAVGGVLVLIGGLGTRPVWAVIETALILGSVFFATGMLGEQVASLRAEQREMRRRLDDVSRSAPRP